jgi:Tetracyclin repressor-like, C-terminal domain
MSFFLSWLTTLAALPLSWRPPGIGAQDWNSGRRRCSIATDASGVPPTPNQVAWLEAGLRCLAGVKLSEQQRLSTVLLLSVFVRSQAGLVLDLLEARQSAGGTEPKDYGRMVRALLDPERFPLVLAIATTGAFEDDPTIDGEFCFGLDRILDGVAVLLQEKRSPRRRGRSSAS